MTGEVCPTAESRNGPPDPETCLLAQIVKFAYPCSYWGCVSQMRLGLMDFFFFTNIKWRFPLAMSLPLRSPPKKKSLPWAYYLFFIHPSLISSSLGILVFLCNLSSEWFPDQYLQLCTQIQNFYCLWTTSSWIAYFPPELTLGLELNLPGIYTTLYHRPYALYQWYFLLFSCISYWAHFWATTYH